MTRRSVLAGLVVGIVAAALEITGLLEPLELNVYDRLFTLRGARTPRAPIVVVTIDNKSLVELGEQWPFPRALHGELISRLAEAKPAVIAFDILFIEPSSRGPGDDETFGDAIKRAGNVVLGAGPVTEDSGAQLGSDVVTYITRVIPNVPIPEIRKGAAAVAPVNLPRSAEDGHIRSGVHRVELGGTPSVGFDAAVHQLAAKAGLPVQPLPEAQEYLINFRGPRQTFAWIPYYQVVRGDVAPARLKGAIVLIGTTVVFDFFATPFEGSGGMPGVEVHANAIETLIVGDRIRDVGRIGAAIVGLALALAASALVARWPRRAWASVCLLLLVLCAVGYLAFVLFNVWVRVVAPSIALGLGLVLTIALSLPARIKSRDLIG